MKIAKILVKFPQLCMNKDRESCYFAAYQAQSFEDALQYEFEHGKEVIAKESIDGARRFAGGQGRAGKL